MESVNDVKKSHKEVFMLLNFKIKNVLSYKDLTEFSLVAGPVKRKKERVFEASDISVLKFSAIYGANASGKSNLIKALQFMKNFVIFGRPKLIKPYYYKLNFDCELPETSYFEVEVRIGKKNYAYGFTFNFYKNIFESEWLYQLTTRGEKKIFERDIINGKFDFNIDLDGELKTKFDVYTDDLKKDTTTLFITFMFYKENNFKEPKLKIIKEIVYWFGYQLDISRPDTVLTSSDYYLFNDKLQELSALLKAFDTGIEEIETIDVSESEVNTSISQDILEKVKRDFEKYINSNRKKLSLVRTGGKFWIFEYFKGIISYKKVAFFHDVDKKIEFSINEESEGTIRILDLAEILLTQESNKVFIIDELDRCLHPQLTVKFIQLFLEKAKELNNQLIVTTHESRLLDFEILRRDEIWFVNKDKGSSNLYSLEEYNERFDKKIDKAYLDGRYGGVPIFDNIFPVIFNYHENNE